MHAARTGLIFTLVAALAGTAPAVATTRTWPGVAPCDATLQACVNASAPTDTVLVAQTTPIAETVSINKPLHLRAATGYQPRIAAGFAIAGNVDAAGSWTWEVSGFTLEQGFIQLQVNGGTQANVILRDNRVLQPISGAALLSIFKPSAVATTLDYRIERNQLAYAWDAFDGSLRAALQVLDGGSGSSAGLIRDNRIAATGNESIGILVSSIDRNHRVAIAGNHVLGGRRGSVFLRQGSLVAAGAGTLQALVTSNLVRSAEIGERRADGIRVDVYDGALELDVLHNTVVDAAAGVDVFASEGTLRSGRIVGNIFAFLGSGAIRRPGDGSVSDSANLFHLTGDSASTPGLSADSIFADPRLREAPHDARLRPDSPARDVLSAGSLLALLDAFGVAGTDADGLRRVKVGNAALAVNPLDLGAFEAGDGSFVHRVASPAPNVFSTVDHASINGVPLAAPQSTQLWNPDGGVGIYNDQQQSLGYRADLERWQLRQEGLASVTPGTAFNLFAPGSGSGRYRHANTAVNTGGSFTTLAAADLDNREDAIVLVTRDPGAGTVVDVVSPLAVNVFAGAWSVVRLDGLPMPASGGFHVYFQPPSINAWRHRSSAANIAGNTTDLSHPLLDGNPCARVHVGQGTDFGPSNPHHIGIYYRGGANGRWAIFNQDFALMPSGVEFHIVVDAAASQCPTDLFADGFETR